MLFNFASCICDGRSESSSMWVGLKLFTELTTDMFGCVLI